MPDPFDAWQYLAHLRARWRLVAAVVAGALATSLVVSLALPKKYTARALLVIEPPAGSDPRAATAVSPIYLESLKTYEHFASSDRLFAQAVEKFQLRGNATDRPIESLKRSVLKVEIPRNTKILEVAVTLEDPRKAHAVARFLAEETVKLNRKTNRAGDDELIEEARRPAEEAARRVAEIEAARGRFERKAPTREALKAELEQLRSMRDEVSRLQLSAELSGPAGRVEKLRKEAADLNHRIAAGQQTLADRTAESDRLDAQYETAWTLREQLQKRLNDLQASAGYRAERLNLLDPGVVPERPSFPNLPLNVVAAAALGLVVSLFYLTVEFSVTSHRAEGLRKTLRVASKP
ncbi:MAG: hypothetical protein HY238_26140 [Acidobacteria bacterium]|nr:hypothetical protein [Acidobacteriota bacterium]